MVTILQIVKLQEQKGGERVGVDDGCGEREV